MTAERSERLLRKIGIIRRNHLAPAESIDLMEGMIMSESDTEKSNRYTAALVEAEKQASLFPSGRDESGREWIEVDGKRYSRDWLIRTSARMKANGDI